MFSFTGIGLGNFKITYNSYFGQEMMHAHNIFLNSFVEMGFPGFLLVLTISLQMLIGGIYILKRKKEKFSYSLILGLNSVFLVF